MYVHGFSIIYRVEAALLFHVYDAILQRGKSVAES